MPSHANGYSRSYVVSTPAGTDGRLMPWNPSAPTTKSQSSRPTSSFSRNVMCGRSPSMSCSVTASISKRTSPPSRNRSAIRSLTTSCWPYTVIARPVRSGEVDAVAAAREAQFDALVAHALGVQALADTRLAQRLGVPCSSTPARTRCSTYSRSRPSSTVDSMPCRCIRCDSSRPAGPAPTMPTWVRMRSSVLRRLRASRLDFR